MVEIPMAVYGNGDLFRELFNAIAATTNDKGYGFLTQFAIFASGTYAIIRYTADRNLMSLLRWLGMFYALFYIALVPARLLILDQVNQGKAYPVDNVPLALAVVAGTTSSMGAGLTEMMEKNFSLPDDLKYGQTGMVMASRLVMASTQFRVTDPNFQQSLQSFVHQCVFYDLLLGKYSWNDLLNSTNLWAFLQQYASPARAFTYYQPGNSQILTCREGVQNQYLGKDWKAALDSAASRYGSRLFPDAVDPKAQLLAYLPNSYNYLTHISDQAANIMQQNMLANAIQDGVMSLSASVNASAALASYAYSKAQAQKRLTNQTIGTMAAYWLPLMKNVLEATLYGVFPFVFVLLLFPWGLPVVKNYVTSLMWLQLWAPLYAIINLFMNFYAQSHSLGALNLGNGTTGLAISSQTGLAQVNADVAGLAGYLSLSVPLLAAGAVKGMMSVFTQAAQYIAGVTQSVAASAAGEAVAGNLSMGNTHFSNHSALNTSANHFDTVSKVFSGGFVTQMPGGSTLSMTADNNLVMSNTPAISSLATSFRVSDSIRETAMRQVETAETAAFNYAHAYANSTATALRGLYELADHQAKSQASGDMSSVSQSGSVQNALNNINRLTDQFARDHKISHDAASERLRSAYVDGHLTGKFDSNNELLGKVASMASGLSVEASGTIGGNASATHKASNSTSDLYSAARNFVQDSGYAHNVDTALRGLAEHSYRTNDEEGQRLADSIGSSYEHSVQAREDMQSSFNKAQSYREAASYAQDHQASIDTNASQLLFEQLQKSTGGNLREIENMEVHDPMAAQQMANQLSQQAADQFLGEWEKSHPISQGSVTQAFKQNEAAIPSDAKIKDINDLNHASVAAQAEQKGLGGASIVDTSAKKQADELIRKDQQAVDAAKSKVENTGSAEKKIIKDHDHQY